MTVPRSVLACNNNLRAFARSTRARARVALLMAAVTMAAGSLTGCATTKAAAAIDGPPLAVPEPPPRVLIPVEEEPLASTPVGPEAPLASVPRVQQPSPQQRRNTPARVEGNPGTDTAASPAATASAPGAPPAEAPRELRPVPTPAEPAPDQPRVQAFLDRAAADRGRVVYSKLSQAGRRNFDDSRKLSEQALKGMKERNFTYALEAAEKAATLAAALVGR